MNLPLNTLQFDTDRRTAVDQAVLLPTGSVPVILVFGDSTSAGADSEKEDLEDSARIVDGDPYFGREIGWLWNGWLNTTDDGATFEAPDRSGLATSGVGTEFQRAIGLGGNSAPFSSTAAANLENVNPIYGLLRGLYGLFRDEETFEVITPRIIQAARGLTFVGLGESDAEKALSWNGAYLDETPGAPYEAYKTPLTVLKDQAVAARTSLAGTKSFLVGAFTTAGFVDTKTSNNTDDNSPATWKAANVGTALSGVRVALEDSLGVDQFPLVATGGRKVTTGGNENDYDNLRRADDSLRALAENEDMVAVTSQSGLGESRWNPEAGNPHLTGQGSYELGLAWASAYRNLLASNTQLVTAPQFSS